MEVVAPRMRQAVSIGFIVAMIVTFLFVAMPKDPKLSHAAGGQAPNAIWTFKFPISTEIARRSGRWLQRGVRQARGGEVWIDLRDAARRHNVAD